MVQVEVDVVACVPGGLELRRLWSCFKAIYWNIFD